MTDYPPESFSFFVLQHLSDSPFFDLKMDLLLKLSVLGWYPGVDIEVSMQK